MPADRRARSSNKGAEQALWDKTGCTPVANCKAGIIVSTSYGQDFLD